MTLEDIKVMNIHQRLNAVMDEVSYVQKTLNVAGKYNAVRHDDVTRITRPLFVKYRIMLYVLNLDYTVEGNLLTAKGTLRFQNIDNPADYQDTQALGQGVDSQDKGPGKAMSYIVKYGILKVLHLETGDDPENDEIEADRTAKPEPMQLKEPKKVANFPQFKKS